MTDQAALLEAVADAAVSLAAERSWDEVALRDIAEAAGVPMARLYGVVASKDDVLDAIAARLDRAAAKDLEIDRAAPMRERLFDAAMARFDAMEERRAGLVSIIEAESAKPEAVVRFLPRGLKTARWLMELAGVDTAGPVGLARASGFALILGRTTRAWLKDDAGGLARTMASLDRSLRDLETWRERIAEPLRRATSRRRSGASSEAPPAGDAPV